MIIELLNGKRIDTSDYNLTRLFHRIPSLEIENVTEEYEGRDGETFLGSNYAGRTISVDFVFQVRDIYDFYLLRDEIHDLFSIKDPFYIIFKREPYKRWKVRMGSSFELEPNPKAGTFTVEFICDNVFAESIATTSDIKEWDVDKWGWNNAIEWDEDLRYSFSENSFVVNNLGNVLIDPRDNELEIVIKVNTSGYIRIKNTTTGDVYQHNGPLSTNDTLKLTGVRSLKNGVSVFGNTNRKLITLAPGENSFVVEGGTIQSITFNFRFLYK